MKKLVIDCGNCVPDFTAISQMIMSNFADVEVVRTHGITDTLEVLHSKPVALVTVNRKLDSDYSDGIEVVKAIKADSNGANIPVMLVSNYPESQEEAMALGAVQGLGKLALKEANTIKLLKQYLL